MRGGDPTVGSITDDGLYRAPPNVPTPSIVTVMAIQNGNAMLRLRSNGGPGGVGASVVPVGPVRRTAIARLGEGTK